MSPSSFSSFLASLRHAWDGWDQVLSTQRSMRIHVSVAFGLCVVCTPLQLEAVETALLLLLVGLVFCAELLNSALEASVDLCTPKQHPLAKMAKDASAAAVLVLAFASVALFFVLFARQWPLLKNEWPVWALPMALLGCSWLLATAGWTWFRHRRTALVCRVVAMLIWLWSWPHAFNLAFWGLGLFLLALGGAKKKKC
jgi:diacylglycerol kinase